MLAFVLVAGWGWGFYLDHFELLYSTQGVVYGAGYTADHVTRVAYWLMVGTAAALCALLVLNVFRPRLRAVVIGAGAYVALYIFAIMLLPALFQRFAVQPNELALETPYLKNNIEFTRKAYSLDTIQETSYPALADLTSDVIARNQDTIQNVRLWDWRPVASDVPTSPGDTALLPVLPGRCGPLPPAGRLSPGDAFGARALRGASC